MLSSIFFRTISSSPRSLCSPKPYLSRQKSHLCKSFERIIMKRGGNSRGGKRNSPFNGESANRRDHVSISPSIYWSLDINTFRNIHVSIHKRSTKQQDGFSQATSAARKDRSFHSRILQQGQMSVENAARDSSKDSKVSPSIGTSNEQSSQPSFGVKGRIPYNGRQHGSTSPDREAGHQSSELPESLTVDAVSNSSEHHKPLPIVQDVCSQDARSGIKDRSSKNERPQSRHSSPESVGSHNISEHPEASSLIISFDIFRIKTVTPVKLKTPLLEKNREKRRELDRTVNKNRILRSGMVLLKNYISHRHQIEILKTCRNLGLGSGGFYQPGYTDGAKLRLQMMCLGKNWEPQTREYVPRRFIDNAEAPRIPHDFIMLVKRAIEESHKLIRQDPKVSNTEQVLPCMNPDVCIVNFYCTTGKLGLHQDRDESPQSLKQGLPVVSFSIGDKAEFLYGDTRDVDKAEKVELESGDVLIFGGESRHIFHGVTSIFPDSAPKSLVDESNLRPGRLNLTFREY